MAVERGRYCSLATTLCIYIEIWKGRYSKKVIFFTDPLLPYMNLGYATVKGQVTWKSVAIYYIFLNSRYKNNSILLIRHFINN